MKLIQQEYRIEGQHSGNRLDQVLHQLLPEYSRSKIQEWIQQGFILLNQKPCKSKQKVIINDLVVLDIPRVDVIEDKPQAIEFDILHQDEDIFIINKPAGLVVHPAAGHADGTLVNGLLALDPDLAQLPRAGIVHRLDKDTTGVMMVARNLIAHNHLVDQFQERLVKKQYVAVTQGVITAGRTIITGIGRHPVNRKKMSVQDDGKESITHFKVRQKFKHHSLVSVEIETGRTHQIRVHMAHIQHPLVGDPVYAGRLKIPAGISENFLNTLKNFKRQALHAETLSFTHPGDHRSCEFRAEWPDDLKALVEMLDQER
ncbi:MAG: 23S rRNA pseudouridine1911/1915/1917 synthase [Gammaproteobacteria bacterium]|jgi:23S rRNA pseudouridine1911/1915/1917 synthase